MANAMIWKHKNYNLIGTNTCYLLEFLEQPELLQETILLAGGQSLNIGDLVYKIGKPGCVLQTQ